VVALVEAQIVQMKIKTADVRLVKELYPRLTEDNAAIERYRAAIGLLPPIAVARNGILVDGYHRWQAHVKEGLTEIEAENLGNLSDAEIIRESISRNASHGQQLNLADKRNLSGRLWLSFGAMKPDERISEIATLLSVTPQSVRTWTKDARAAEKANQQGKAWDMWLDCYSHQDIANEIGIDRSTVDNWIGEKRKTFQNSPPESRQHFDIWQFSKSNGDSSYFGQMPPQVVENLLWFYTKSGETVFDPFAGGGTTIKIAKEMGRRVWSSDIVPSTPMLPIHEHNILDGWPTDAPSKADFILLDPPYWQQAYEKYGDHPQNLGNMSLEAFYTAWAEIIKTCSAHISSQGRIAYIISPTQCEDGSVIDHTTDMLRACWKAHLVVERRVIVPYSTQQATGQQVTWARENRRLLKLYRDLVILKRGS
jgi:DNA methylase